MYLPLMAQLADRFYLVAPDTPGFGASDALPAAEPGAATVAGIADYARAMHEFIVALELAPCGVFGHHTGAAIAVQLEHDYPGTARAMALSGPTLLDETQKRTLPDLASPFELREDGGHLLCMWQRIRAKDPAAALVLSQRETLSALACGDAYQASYRAVTRQDFAGQLGKIVCPLLVYAGDQDPLYGAVAPTLARLPQGDTVQLPGGERTYVCERQAGLIGAILGDFFADKLSAGEELK